MFIYFRQLHCEARATNPIYLKLSGRTGASASASLTLYTAILQGVFHIHSRTLGKFLFLSWIGEDRSIVRAYKSA